MASFFILGFSFFLLVVQAHTDISEPPTFDPTDVAMVEIGTSAEISADTLSCKCEDYSCSCSKECLCKITSTQGAKNPVGHNPATGKKPMSFRCGCDFGPVDYSMTKDEGLDCECSAAKCKCEKKCTCSSGTDKQAGFKEIFHGKEVPEDLLQKEQDQQQPEQEEEDDKFEIDEGDLGLN